MLMSHGLFNGTLYSRELANTFSGIKAAGLGVEVGEDRVTTRGFLVSDTDGASAALGALSAVPILAGFALPAMAQAREKSQTSACSSNLKQIALGAMMYSQDYDETLPGAAGWDKQLNPYLKNKDVLHDPSDEARGISYAMNRRLSAVKMSRIAHPEKTILFYEIAARTGSPNGVGQDQAVRHKGGSNVAYADGHVKRVEGMLDVSAFSVTLTPVKAVPPKAKPGVGRGKPQIRRGVRRSGARSR